MRYLPIAGRRHSAVLAAACAAFLLAACGRLGRFLRD